MSCKIIISIEGGVVRDILSTQKDIEIVTIDYDCTKNGSTMPDISEVISPDRSARKLSSLYLDNIGTTEEEQYIHDTLRNMGF